MHVILKVVSSKLNKLKSYARHVIKRKKYGETLTAIIFEK